MDDNILGRMEKAHGKSAWKKRKKRMEKTDPYGYIMKPFDDNALHASVTAALRNGNAEGGLELQCRAHSALNTILRISLEPISLVAQLHGILEAIIAAPWLGLESRGAIFTADDSDETLELKVHRGFSEELIAACSRVPFGKCLCGKETAERNAVFAECIAGSHKIIFEGMDPHGHFCVPIMRDGKLLGVITLYVKQRCGKTGRNEGFLADAADIVAAIITGSGARCEQEALIAELGLRNEELKLLREKIIQSENMAALGRLVAGVAHEINTPIGNSLMSASHMQEKTREIMWMLGGNMITKSNLEKYFQTASEDCDIMLNNLHRSSDLIKSFKTVSGDQTSRQRRKFKLRRYVEDIVLSLKPTFRKTSHSIAINCREGLELDSYPGAFAQIVTNLLINAVNHAFDEGSSGNIEIDIFESARNVVMIVADDGKGIPDETLCKVFDPFFTTGSKDGNSGLGLHIVYNIVTETLKGDVYCESTPGEGTSFVITFPKELK